MGRRVVQGAAMIAMGFVGIAGAAKLVDVPHFAAQIQEYAVLPSWMRAALVFALPVFELALGLAWFVQRRRLPVALAGLALVGLASAAFLWQWTSGSPPRCACFGRLSVYLSGLQEALWTLLRNGLLCVSLIGWIGLVRDGASTADSPSPSPSSP
jgi:hypothetical protein